MKHRIMDQAERQQALAVDTSFIIQAPAGSGKTELLIQRYLRLLDTVEYPEEIIAITFTRKAASEMQARIISALQRARAGTEPRDDATRQTDELALAVLQRDGEQGWRLEDNPGRLRIQTIDSLCGWLVRQMPVLAGLGAQPELLDDASELYLQASVNTLAELESGEHWSDDIAVLLAHLDNNLVVARNMLAEMLARRDQWLRHIAGNIDRDTLESAFGHAIEATLEIALTLFPAEYQEEMLGYLRFAAGNLAAEGSDSVITHCREIKAFPGFTVTDLPPWLAISELCLTTSNTWRKQVNKQTGFPAADKTAEGEIRKRMKDGVQALLSRLSGDEELLSQLTDIRCLPPLHYTDADWQVVRALCELLKLADAHLSVLFGERNQIDFTGITRAAIQALGQEDTPTDLALRLDYRIRHLLIDEFQDVSVNQYELVERLTAGWSHGDGHSLFLVGDPMQSIYRFREAEVGLFLDTWEQKRLGQVSLVPLNIRVNFRSQAGVVDWVNDAFSHILPEVADSTRGAVSYASAVAFHSVVGTRAVCPHLAASAVEEGRQIVQLIQSARQEDPAQRIAILVRNRNHLLEITPALKAAGLRFKAVEIDELGQRPAIQDLLALTRALDHLADRIAWLAILRAPWCGLSLDDLLLLTNGDQQKTVWECMHSPVRLDLLPEEGRQRLLRVKSVLEQALTQQGRRSLRRTVESVWLGLGGPATLNDESDLENAGEFFELLEQYDEGGSLSDRLRFEEQVGKLFAAADVHADDSLQIMTIHKAKGLEFDQVIVPSLERRGRNNEARLLTWAESPHHGHKDLLLAPVKQAGQTRSPFYDYLNLLENQKQDHELGRLLYVAATRPRNKLHLFTSIQYDHEKAGFNQPAKNSLLRHLWPVLEQEYIKLVENLMPVENGEGDSGVIEFNCLRRLPCDWQLPGPPPEIDTIQVFEQQQLPDALPEYEWAGETIKHIGSVVHRYLQLMAEEGLALWTASYITSQRFRLVSALKRYGVPDTDLSWATDNVEAALLRTLDDERGRWILGGEHEAGACELPVTGVIDNCIVNVVLDRTFIDKEGNRWIIDYKTSRHEGTDLNTFLEQEEERYMPQLNRYARLMQALEDKPTRLGLYFPLLQAWRELTLLNRVK